MSAPKFPPTYHPPRVPKDWELRAEMIAMTTGRVSSSSHEAHEGDGSRVRRPH